MGANVSTQSVKSVSKLVNNVLNDISSEISMETTSTSSSKQYMKIVLRGLNCDNINSSQGMSNKLVALSKLNSTQLNDIESKLKNKVSKEIQLLAKQKNSGLNLGQMNVSTMNTLIDNYVANNISNVIKTKISNSIKNTTDGEQIMEIDARGIKCKNFVSSQEMVIEQLSTNIAETLVSNTMKTVAENEDLQKVTLKADQENAGLTMGFGIVILIVVLGLIYMARTLMKYVIPILMLACIYPIWYYYDKEQYYTCAAFITLLVLLTCLEIYVLFSNPMSAIPQLPKKFPSKITVTASTSSTPSTPSTPPPSTPPPSTPSSESSTPSSASDDANL